MASSFETKQAAKERRDNEMAAELAGKRRKRNHSGRLDNITWNCNGLKAEVEGYPDGTKVNWTDLARQYQIKNSTGEIAKNGGQIAKDWLSSQGVDIQRFTRKRPLSNPEAGQRHVRKKKLRSLGGKHGEECKRVLMP